MLHIEHAGKLFYCPLKDNRQVNEGDQHQVKYQRVDLLSWSEAEQAHGKSVHVKDFPAGHRLQLFRLVLSTERTDYVVTNDRTQLRPMTLNRRVPSGGRLSSCTAKSNKPPGWNDASAVN